MGALVILYHEIIQNILIEFVITIFLRKVLASRLLFFFGCYQVQGMNNAPGGTRLSITVRVPLRALRRYLGWLDDKSNASVVSPAP